MIIQELLCNFVADIQQIQNLNFEVSGLALNTKTMLPGDLFFAMKGHTQDGRRYLLEAIQKGACALVVEHENSHLFPILDTSPIPVIKIEALHTKISEIAGLYYDHPSHDLRVIGITGTNGKTTCAYLLSQALNQLNIPCGMIGTLTHELTTPDAITIQSELNKFKKMGMKAVVMEVSSHGLSQHRVQGICFESAIFTNLTQDHLDYHGSMLAYGAAKQKLFAFKSLKRMILNAEDPFTQVILQQGALCPAVLYSRSRDNILVNSQKAYLSIVASNIQLNTQGIQAMVHTPWGEAHLSSNLLGDFNLSNILCVLAELRFQTMAQAIPLEKLIESIGWLVAPPGRMQYWGGGVNPVILVDYAHTPDALYNALKTARAQCGKILWCIFGCGGERDKLKRPKMGKIAATMADKVIVTADNSRREPTANIVADILKEVSSEYKDQIMIEEDREKAIAYAIGHACAQDVILVAGKGHESYQQMNDQRLNFSDGSCVQMYLNQKV